MVVNLGSLFINSLFLFANPRELNLQDIIFYFYAYIEFRKSWINLYDIFSKSVQVELRTVSKRHIVQNQCHNPLLTLLRDFFDFVYMLYA